MLGITRQALLEPKMPVVRITRGVYDLEASLLAYCKHLRDAAAGRGGDGSATLTKERARLAREQADGTALKNAEARGEMVRASDVEARWRDAFAGLRSRMLAVPSRVRMALPHLTTTEVGAITQEVRTALEEAARGDA